MKIRKGIEIEVEHSGRKKKKKKQAISEGSCVWACNEERGGRSKDSKIGEDVKVKRKETPRFDGEERKVEKKRKNGEKDDVFGHVNDGEVKKRKKEKRDHMQLFDDKETTVENKKKSKKDNVVIVEREMEMKRNDMKARNKEKRRKRKVKEMVNNMEADCEVVTPERNKSKRVRFSDEVKVFAPSESPMSSSENKGGLVQGKRFSKEENELIKEAVEKYLKAMQLGEEGLDMILECKSQPLIRGCWKVIGAALPWRPYRSVYQRARRLYIRGESKWTPEEVELVRESYKKYGPKWKRMADELGKYHVHVRNAFQRYQLVDLKKGKWSQDEYRALFELVNEDLLMKVSEEKKSKHGMLRDNIHWEAISDRLGTRNNATCCQKWYNQLTSPMVARGEWADVDDYRLLFVLVDLDASCEDEVDWDCLLQHRSGDICRKRWMQMSLHHGERGNKSFSEQVEILSNRYYPDFAQVREALDARPVVD